MPQVYPPQHGNTSRLFTSAPCFAFGGRIFDFLLDYSPLETSICCQNSPPFPERFDINSFDRTSCSCVIQESVWPLVLNRSTNCSCITLILRWNICSSIEKVWAYASIRLLKLGRSVGINGVADCCACFCLRKQVIFTKIHCVAWSISEMQLRCFNSPETTFLVPPLSPCLCGQPHCWPTAACVLPAWLSHSSDVGWGPTRDPGVPVMENIPRCLCWNIIKLRCFWPSTCNRSNPRLG